MRTLVLRTIMAGLVWMPWAGAASAKGLLKNGQFSGGTGEPPWPPAWEAAANARQRFAWVDVDGYASNDSLVVFGEKGEENATVAQTFSCAKGAQLVLTAALKGTAACRPVVTVVDPAGGTVLATLQASDTNAWVLAARRFNSGDAEKLQVRIRAAGRSGKGAVDAVDVFPADAVPKDLQVRDWFDPPGPNIARGKKTTLQPRPNYSYCTDPNDIVQLTDGVYTSGYFWVQKSTVGWQRAVPVTVTVDLGKVEPIAGASINTAAGVAGVAWPYIALVLVSDDGKTWYEAGELVRQTLRQAPPPPKNYAVHRFAASGWRTHGRYVRFMIGQSPYCFLDEVEVYRGSPAWVKEQHTGKAFTDSRSIRSELFVKPQITMALEWRLQNDLKTVVASLKSRVTAAPERTAALAKAAELKTEIENLDDVPADLRTILPIGPLHTRILALNAVVLRACGWRGVQAWKNNRWDTLAITEVPDTVPQAPPALSISMMRGEVRSDAFNLTNATDRPVQVTLDVEGLPKPILAKAISLRNVLFTDTRSRSPIAAALPEAERMGTSWRVTIPAGTTKQIWVSIERPGNAVKAGAYRGRVIVRPAGSPAPLRLPFFLRLFDLDFPADPALSLGGWDYTNGSASYYRAPGNLTSLMRLFRDFNVNSPWATNSVAPSGMHFDKQGHLTNPDALNFRPWDEWVKRWDFARNYCVFLAIGTSFQGEKMGTPRFDRMVGEWFRAWAAHVRDQGIETSRVVVLLLDEPHDPKQDEIIIAWAKAVRAAKTGIRLFEDPTYRKPKKGLPDMFALADILCPNTPMMVGQGESFRRFYLDQQAQGRELWLYSCSGPAKQLDPCAYHRGQMWWAMRMGAKGCFYWALGCGGGIGDSWRAYAQTNTEFSPFFVGQNEVVDGKHMEAIREGVEDYQTFVMLRLRLRRLKARGVENQATRTAQRLLRDGPKRVTDTITSAAFTWNGNKADHAVMDKVRVQMLEALAALEGK